MHMRVHKHLLVRVYHFSISFYLRQYNQYKVLSSLNVQAAKGWPTQIGARHNGSKGSDDVQRLALLSPLKTKRSKPSMSNGVECISGMSPTGGDHVHSVGGGSQTNSSSFTLRGVTALCQGVLGLGDSFCFSTNGQIDKMRVEALVDTCWGNFAHSWHIHCCFLTSLSCISGVIAARLSHGRHTASGVWAAKGWPSLSSHFITVQEYKG